MHDMYDMGFAFLVTASRFSGISTVSGHISLMFAAEYSDIICRHDCNYSKKSCDNAWDFENKTYHQASWSVPISKRFILIYWLTYAWEVSGNISPMTSDSAMIYRPLSANDWWRANYVKLTSPMPVRHILWATLRRCAWLVGFIDGMVDHARRLVASTS